jgi:hypothetical protein
MFAPPVNKTQAADSKFAKLMQQRRSAAEIEGAVCENTPEATYAAAGAQSSGVANFQGSSPSAPSQPCRPRTLSEEMRRRRESLDVSSGTWENKPEETAADCRHSEQQDVLRAPRRLLDDYEDDDSPSASPERQIESHLEKPRSRDASRSPRSRRDSEEVLFESRFGATESEEILFESRPSDESHSQLSDGSHSPSADRQNEGSIDESRSSDFIKQTDGGGDVSSSMSKDEDTEKRPWKAAGALWQSLKTSVADAKERLAEEKLGEKLQSLKTSVADAKERLAEEKLGEKLQNVKEKMSEKLAEKLAEENVAERLQNVKEKVSQNVREKVSEKVEALQNAKDKASEKLAVAALERYNPDSAVDRQQLSEFDVATLDLVLALKDMDLDSFDEQPDELPFDPLNQIDGNLEISKSS